MTIHPFVELIDALCIGGLVDESSIVAAARNWRSIPRHEQEKLLLALADRPTEDLARLVQIFSQTSPQQVTSARA